ncbi:TRAM domain-containing protein [Methanonatronarchaeum sp. AMET6-2]|uniref:TRAM domain-containing protein n=1 Tax=Methanonatronarchaeum sp. AMET6-2 TaxID=2933293 RepID=UPI0011F5FC23|nr:TRAM domain-containing protein [Methanonatronarchaeum sp. AMET6-2]RZN63414.1 MAG: TRAM domain-containing protein [Methanonatronarchaeia archaeon]UOY10081.1 TRAM domain-containing protein [Methanonatronarchaeum sp. AMET6-2]
MNEGFSNPPTPIEEGEHYDVEIEDTGKEGDGIAKIENFVVFVPNAGVGEKVTVEIETVKSTFGVGKVVN